MLSIEIQQLKMKKTDTVDLVKPLKNFISKQYGENVAKEYETSLQNLQQKRGQLLNLQERSEGSKDLCMKYAAELDYIAKHFPINSGAPRVNITFSWFDSLTSKKVSQGNTAYEKANVLFNAAVLEMQIAAAENRQTETGVVAAAKRFQSAAGIFLYIKEKVTPNIVERITDDLTPDCLDALTNLMLAYAQMCVCENAKKKKMKNSLISMLCLECSSMFEGVAGQLMSSSLSLVFPKTWSAYCNFVAVYYNALSQFYAGVDLHEKDEIGKEIARLTRALELSKDAKNYKISASLREAIDEFEREVNKCLEIAVRDNNKVYHERIPAFDTLDPIEKKRPVKPTVIANLADETNVSDAFFNLFPIPVMEAKVKYTEQVTVKLQNAFRGTREHREKLKQHLAQMGLPGSILAADQKQGFPKDVHDKIQKIESAGGIRRLHELKTTLDEMAVEANQLCEKIKQTLDQEAADDNECRQQYGQRWPRLASQNLTVNLYKQLNEYSSKIKQAQMSDQLVDQKISESKEGFSHFSKPRESIDMLMPSIDVSNANTEFGKSYNDLKQLLGQLDDLFTREEMIEREIADMQRLENIEQTLLKHEGNLDQCVNNELLKYDEKLNQLQPIQQQLDQTMSAIVSANQQFVQRQTTDKQRKREQVIQSMYASINKYHEILANIQEGINFYTTMQDIIKKLQQRVGDFVFARRTEKQDLIANLQTQLSGIPVQPYGAQQPPIGHQPVYQTQQLPYGNQPVYQTQQSQQYMPQQQQRYYNPQQLPPTPYQQQPQYQYGVQPQNPYGSQPSNRR